MEKYSGKTSTESYSRLVVTKIGTEVFRVGNVTCEAINLETRVTHDFKIGELLQSKIR